MTVNYEGGQVQYWEFDHHSKKADTLCRANRERFRTQPRTTAGYSISRSGSPASAEINADDLWIIVEMKGE